MMRIAVPLPVLVFLLVTGGMTSAQTAAEMIQAGDEAYARFDDAGALVQYEKAAKLESNNYEALWKTSRAYFDVGDRVDPRGQGAKERKIENYTAGENYGLRAVQANSNDAWGHFFYAASIGQHALLLSKKEQVARSKKVKAE